jgi:hypothetical protein
MYVLFTLHGHGWRQIPLKHYSYMVFNIVKSPGTKPKSEDMRIPFKYTITWIQTRIHITIVYTTPSVGDCHLDGHKQPRTLAVQIRVCAYSGHHYNIGPFCSQTYHKASCKSAQNVPACKQCPVLPSWEKGKSRYRYNIDVFCHCSVSRW